MNRFLTLEGIDGCGKSTQARLLVEWLSRKFGSENVVHTFEPGGGTDAGTKIREIILRSQITSRSELLLFLADRTEHTEKVILPAMRENKWVVCERYTDSTIAYQSAGRGIPVCEIEKFFFWCDFPIPALTFFIDVPVDIAAVRVAARKNKDRIEASGIEFMHKLNSAYHKLVAEKKRIVLIDGSGDIESMSDNICNIVESKFELQS